MPLVISTAAATSGTLFAVSAYNMSSVSRGAPRVMSLQCAAKVPSPRDMGTTDGFQTANWYRALVQKTAFWAAVARDHVGELLLCSDNDVTLLPGWPTALPRACDQTLDLCFQREGGDDPFFDPFPYNSGFFLMRGSPQTAAFWREVSAQTGRGKPFAGDQTTVNALLHQRTAGGHCAASGAEVAASASAGRHGCQREHGHRRRRRRAGGGGR